MLDRIKLFNSPLVADTQQLRYVDDGCTLQVLGIQIPNKHWIELVDQGYSKLSISKFDIVISYDSPDYFTMFLEVGFPDLEYYIHGKKFRQCFIRSINKEDNSRDESPFGRILNDSTVVEIISNKNNRSNTTSIEVVCKLSQCENIPIDLKGFFDPVKYIVDPSKGLTKYTVPVDEGEIHHISFSDVYSACVHLITGDVLIQDGYSYKVHFIDERDGEAFCLLGEFGKEGGKFFIKNNVDYNEASKEFITNGLFYAASDSGNPDADATYKRLAAKIKD